MNIGDVSFTARTTPGPGCLLADGSAVSRTTYAGLFAAIGTTFGDGDGTNTFNLPDCRGRVLVAINGDTARLKNRAAGGVDADAVGNIGGEEMHALAPLEQSASQLDTDTQLLDSDPNGNFSSTGNPVGNGQGHNNVQPCIVLLPVIYAGV